MGEQALTGGDGIWRKQQVERGKLEGELLGSGGVIHKRWGQWSGKGATVFCCKGGGG